ncbi:uncharacterized protein LOC124497329 [Dermatophagoides farinae]|uniref:uncharacterized protein LOC124497329 n=1 Tax=Dermatophagoides farinae TaxID=6954 RepID=UPI003F60EDC3
MGQMMTTTSMERPPYHRPGEHFVPYDANSWRRLSSTYLNQLMSNGKLTKDELEIIELERYWRNRKQSNYSNHHRRSYSLSPVEQQQQRRRQQLYNHGGRLNGASSMGNLTASNYNENVGHSFHRQTPVLRNFQQSSHRTKKGDSRYHSLVNVSSIKPTRDNIEKLASNLNDPIDYKDVDHHQSKQHHRKPLSSVRTFQNEHFSPHDSSFSSYDSSNQSGSVNQQRAGRFERNKIGARKTMINSTSSGYNEKNDNNVPVKNEPQKYPANFRLPDQNREPRKFQEYFPKSASNHHRLLSNDKTVKTEFQNQEQEPFLNHKDNHHEKFTNDSPDSDFTRNDSIRTTGDRRNFTPDPMCQSTERLVEKERRQNNNKLDSSFKRRQQQSLAPDFRISSQEHLDQSYKSIQTYDFNVHNNNNNHSATNNRVHFNSNDDEQKRNGSAQLMRHNQQQRQQNGHSIGYFDTGHTNYYSNYYQSFDRPHLMFSKIIYIILLVANICLVIWNSIYMHFASIKIKLGEPIDGRLYSMSHVQRHLWQAIVIAIISLNCITTMVAIYATIRQKYWPIFITTILFYLFASFGSFSEFLRGSISSWLLPLICGHFGIIVTHHIAIDYYSI